MDRVLRQFASLMITLLICSAPAESLQAQDDELCTLAYSHIAIDSSGILTALTGDRSGLVRGRPGQLRNVGPDVMMVRFTLTPQGKLFATGGGNLYRLDSDSIWTRLPEGDISLMGADGSGILYGVAPIAMDSTGVYRSTDEGASWELRSVAGEWPSHYFTVSPNGDLYAKMGSSSADIIISRDGGATWQAPESWPGDNTIRVIHFDADGTPIAASGYLSLFYRDSTGTWREPPRTSRLHMWAFAEVPESAGTDRGGDLYACNGIGDIVRSTDRGATWEPLIYGGADYPTGAVNDLAADREFLYVATENGLWSLHHENLTFEQCEEISGVEESGSASENVLRPYLR